MTKWSNLPYRYDCDESEYHWEWISEKADRQKRQVFFSGSGWFAHPKAIELEQCWERDKQGYWIMRFWEQPAGYLRDRPTRQLRKDAQTHWNAFMKALPVLPVEPVSDKYEELALLLSAGQSALQTLIGYLEEKQDYWTNRFDRDMYEVLTYQDKRDMSVALEVISRVGIKLGRVKVDYTLPDTWLTACSFWKQRLIVDEHEADRQAEEQAERRAKLEAAQQRIAQEKANPSNS